MTTPEFLFWIIVGTTVLIETLGGYMWYCCQREVDQCRK